MTSPARRCEGGAGGLTDKENTMDTNKTKVEQYGVREITLEQLVSDYDWAQVFADENAGNVDKTTHAAPPHSLVDLTPPSRSDVAEIIAAVNGENDGADWLGVFRLKDGRYLVASGGCDYTGWDCRAGNNLMVAKDWNDLIAFGLTEAEADRLGLKAAAQ